MKEKAVSIQIGGKPFDLVFNLSAMADAIERYGELENIRETLSKNKVKAIREEYPWLIALMANQGTALKNEATGGNEPEINEKYVLLHMKPKEMLKYRDRLMEAMTLGLTIEGGDNEEVDEVLDEVRSKNGTGAEDP